MSVGSGRHPAYARSMSARIATDGDIDGIVETLSLAFADDPLWGWAFPDGDGLAAMMRLFAGSALRFPWTWIAGNFDAVAVWIPPGEIELTDAEEASIQPLLERHVGDRARDVRKLVDAFEEYHPDERPHYYLSLLGTHPSARGRGVGMGLLNECLIKVDQEGMPAYLESSNPSNDHRYERHGFRKIGSFDRPDGGSTAATMWREPR